MNSALDALSEPEAATREASRFVPAVLEDAGPALVRRFSLSAS
jgi:hypothetical protein